MAPSVRNATKCRVPLINWMVFTILITITTPCRIASHRSSSPPTLRIHPTTMSGHRLQHSGESVPHKPAVGQAVQHPLHLGEGNKETTTAPPRLRLTNVLHGRFEAPPTDDFNDDNDECENVDNLDVNCDGVGNENLDVGDVGDEKGGNEKDCENNNDKDQFQRKKRKKVSKAHTEFNEVIAKDGSIKLQCIHCKVLLSKSASSTTSHLWNHLKRCIQKKVHTKNQNTLQFQNAKSKFETPPLSNGKYDHMKKREAIAHWILMHEQPLNVVENYGFTFMFKVNLPQFEKISRAMAKNDVITVYDIEKKKLQSLLKTIN
nr:zinc finger BED domain-containing protein RICESLEEPER 2-like [Ipomoea batatas]